LPRPRGRKRGGARDILALIHVNRVLHSWQAVGTLIKPIQYLRGLAALLVVWAHALGQIPGNMALIRVPDFGLSGVDLFFVISGFIMFVTTVQRPLTPREFILLRIARVVPLYWLMTLLMIGCALLVPGAFRTLRLSLTAVLKSLFFVPYDSLSFPGQAWPVLVPGWTLNYEMFFYALFALALIIPLRWRLMSLVLTLVCLVITGRNIGASQSPIVWVYTNPLLLEFAAGAVIGYLWARESPRIPLVASAVAIGAGSCLLVMRNEPPLMGYSQMLGALLVVAGCLHPAIAMLRSRLLLALGNASYSIYLTHIFILGALRMVWMHLVPQASSASAVTFMIIALVACAAGGVAGHEWLEAPLTAMVRRALTPRGAVPISSVAAPG